MTTNREDSVLAGRFLTKVSNTAQARLWMLFCLLLWVEWRRAPQQKATQSGNIEVKLISPECYSLVQKNTSTLLLQLRSHTVVKNECKYLTGVLAIQFFNE